MKRTTKRLTAIFLLLVLLLPAVNVQAQARASLYLDSYSAYVNPDGNGNISVWYTVVGTGYMDEIGAVNVAIKESNGTTVKTYQSMTTPSMLGKNTFAYGSSVSYAGKIGTYYYAVVTIYAGKNGSGDSRQYTTPTVKAT